MPEEAGVGDEGGVGCIGGGVRLLHLFHEKHASSAEEGGQRIHHEDDGGGRGKLWAEAVQCVEDECMGRHGRVVVGEGVCKLLLAAAVVGDGGGDLDQLTEVIVEVDGFAGLVSGEELVDGEPQLARGLVLGEDHVSDVLIDGGVKEVEDGVVLGRPCGVSWRSGDGAVDMADETRPPERGLHVDFPLDVVGGVEGQDDGGDMEGSAAGG
jgi:hypothetical protein